MAGNIFLKDGQQRKALQEKILTFSLVVSTAVCVLLSLFFLRPSFADGCQQFIESVYRALR